MTLNKTLLFATFLGGAALLLAGCSLQAPVSSDSSTVTERGQSASEVTVLPFNAGGFLASNVTPTFPAGHPNEVSVVAQGPLQLYTGGAVLAFAYRNNTGAAVTHVEFSATANLNDKLVETGSSDGAIPAQIQPGEIGLAFIYFHEPGPMRVRDLRYSFTPETSPVNSSPYNTAPLKVSDVTNDGNSIVGTAVNNTGAVLMGPFAAQAYCFNGHDLTIATAGSFADQDNAIAVDDQVSFTIELNDRKCSSFAVGVSGYYQ